MYIQCLRPTSATALALGRCCFLQGCGLCGVVLRSVAVFCSELAERNPNMTPSRPKIDRKSITNVENHVSRIIGAPGGCPGALHLCLSGPSRWRPPQVAPVARQGGGARLAARAAARCPARAQMAGWRAAAILPVAPDMVRRCKPVSRTARRPSKLGKRLGPPSVARPSSGCH